MGDDKIARTSNYNTIPMNVDMRTAPKGWAEVCTKERMCQRAASSPSQLASERTKDDLPAIRDLTKQLELCSADYGWQTRCVGTQETQKVKVPQGISAMAQLATGVGEAEASQSRQTPNGTRQAHATQLVNIAPWQMSSDYHHWRADALASWVAQQKTLDMPRPPTPLKSREATIAGPHAQSVAAWRNSDVALSQWEISARSDVLAKANQIASAESKLRSRTALAKLLKTTGGR